MIPAAANIPVVPHGIDDIKRMYGDIKIDSLGKLWPPSWEDRNMILLPSLPGFDHHLYVNRAIVAPLQDALRLCVELHDNYTVKHIGCFAPRMKRTKSTDLSTHSWGVAIDLNPDTNPLSTHEGGVVIRDIPDAWVDAFESVGWTWGGRWRRADPMHFQMCSGY